MKAACYLQVKPIASHPEAGSVSESRSLLSDWHRALTLETPSNYFTVSTITIKKNTSQNSM